jgi:hypothetical protein
MLEYSRFLVSDAQLFFVLAGIVWWFLHFSVETDFATRLTGSPRKVRIRAEQGLRAQAAIGAQGLSWAEFVFIGAGASS